MTRDSQAERQATSAKQATTGKNRAAGRDEALWLIITVRLLQGLIIFVLWWLGPALIKALGF